MTIGMAQMIRTTLLRGPRRAGTRLSATMVCSIFLRWLRT